YQEEQNIQIDSLEKKSIITSKWDDIAKLLAEGGKILNKEGKFVNKNAFECLKFAIVDNDELGTVEINYEPGKYDLAEFEQDRTGNFSEAEIEYQIERRENWEEILEAKKASREEKNIALTKAQEELKRIVEGTLTFENPEAHQAYWEPKKAELEEEIRELEEEIRELEEEKVFFRAQQTEKNEKNCSERKSQKRLLADLTKDFILPERTEAGKTVANIKTLEKDMGAELGTLTTIPNELETEAEKKIKDKIDAVATVAANGRQSFYEQKAAQDKKTDLEKAVADLDFLIFKDKFLQVHGAYLDDQGKEITPLDQEKENKIRAYYQVRAKADKITGSVMGQAAKNELGNKAAANSIDLPNILGDADVKVIIEKILTYYRDGLTASQALTLIKHGWGTIFDNACLTSVEDINHTRELLSKIRATENDLAALSANNTTTAWQDLNSYRDDRIFVGRAAHWTTVEIFQPLTLTEQIITSYQVEKLYQHYQPLAEWEDFFVVAINDLKILENDKEELDRVLQLLVDIANTTDIKQLKSNHDVKNLYLEDLVGLPAKPTAAITAGEKTRYEAWLTNNTGLAKDGLEEKRAPNGKTLTKSGIPVLDIKRIKLETALELEDEIKNQNQTALNN
ncbi:8420_t:CDS:10, partial [Ambispora leptoticha]